MINFAKINLFKNTCHNSIGWCNYLVWVTSFFFLKSAMDHLDFNINYVKGVKLMRSQHIVFLLLESFGTR